MTKKVWNFIILNFSLSWLLAGLLKIFNIKLISSLGILLGVLYMFCPLVSVVILEKFLYHGSIKETCSVNFKLNWWFLMAWLLPFFVSFASFGVAVLFPGVEISPTMEGFFERFANTYPADQIELMKKQISEMPVSPVIVMSIQALFAGATINALAAFGEEVGWRGLLYNELIPKFNFWQTSLIIGFIWGLWHAPLILQGHNYPNFPGIGVLWMIIFCILYSPIFNFIREKTNSVVSTSILHGTINATFGFSILFLKGGNELTVGVLGLSGFIVLLIIDVIIYLLKS